MATTVSELIEFLEQFDGDVEVRFASQPQWAFEYSVELSEQDPIEVKDDGRKTQAVYLAEGRQIGYLPHKAAVAVGWAEQRGDEDEED